MWKTMLVTSTINTKITSYIHQITHKYRTVRIHTQTSHHTHPPTIHINNSKHFIPTSLRSSVKQVTATGLSTAPRPITSQGLPGEVTGIQCSSFFFSYLSQRIFILKETRQLYNSLKSKKYWICIFQPCHCVVLQNLIR